MLVFLRCYKSFSWKLLPSSFNVKIMVIIKVFEKSFKSLHVFVFSCIMCINSFSWQNNLVCIYQLSFITNVHFIYAETSVGVFAKRTIQKNVQFGPFVGELVMKDSDINSKFPLAVSFYILQANTFWQFHITV